MVPWAARIARYCDNPRLAMKVDWPAFERMDLQAMIGAEEGGRDGSRAADPSYVTAERLWMLDGDKRRDDVSTSPIAGAAGFIAEPMEKLCRDHKELRAAVARITTIVIEPIYDMKYLSDKDAIGYAHRTNDWEAVHEAFYNEKRDMKNVFRAYRWRWKVSGTTLYVWKNVFGKSGDADDDEQALVDAFGGSSAPAAAPPVAGADDPPAESAGPWDGRYTVLSSRGGSLCPRPDAWPLVVRGGQFSYPWRLGSGLTRVGQLTGEIGARGKATATTAFDHPYPRAVAPLSPARLDRVRSVVVTFTSGAGRTATLALDLGGDLRCNIVWVAPAIASSAPPPPPPPPRPRPTRRPAPPPPEPAEEPAPAPAPEPAPSGPTREQREEAHSNCLSRCFDTQNRCSSRCSEDDDTCRSRCPTGDGWGDCLSRCGEDKDTCSSRCSDDESSCQSSCPD
ncbi:MAG TPA: hypothetical protein VLX92_29170 [Kofleriaceae bacterium]|nr:hypothetical protein [Kofleriaceae bacterium]